MQDDEFDEDESDGGYVPVASLGVGQRFGSLTVRDCYQLEGCGAWVAAVRCDCGVRKMIRAQSVTRRTNCGFSCRLVIEEQERQHRDAKKRHRDNAARGRDLLRKLRGR